GNSRLLNAFLLFLLVHPTFLLFLLVHPTSETTGLGSPKDETRNHCSHGPGTAERKQRTPPHTYRTYPKRQNKKAQNPTKNAKAHRPGPRQGAPHQFQSFQFANIGVDPNRFENGARDRVKDTVHHASEYSDRDYYKKIGYLAHDVPTPSGFPISRPTLITIF